MEKVIEVKQKFDDVLDNLNFIVDEVVSRDNMMLKCKPNIICVGGILTLNRRLVQPKARQCQENGLQARKQDQRYENGILITQGLVIDCGRAQGLGQDRFDSEEQA